MITQRRIRIKLESYDPNLIDKSSTKIIQAAKSAKAVVMGPIPLPTHKEVFTVLSSPNVYKKSREKFKLCTHKRLIDIHANSSKVTDALAKIELASGISISIKS